MATKQSRTYNTLRNIVAGIVNKIALILLPFVVRTFLIDRLGVEYVGISSLFTSILQVLNVTELGFSAAIIYAMYEPVARNDLATIKEKLQLYKTIYRVVGIIILLGGVVALPFLSLLIHGDYPSDINIYIIFGIYLANTAISYLTYGYKNSILVVYQRNDLVSKTSTAINILKCFFQIIILLTITNFYAYVIILPLTTLASNLIINTLVTRHYPELTGKYNISFKGLGAIKKQVVGIAIGRISLVCRDSFDSIILSSLFGLTLTAIYSNYYTIFSAVSGFMGIILVSMAASVGNSLVTDTIEKNERDHLKFDFYYEFLVGVCTICMFTMYQPFMRVWLGEGLMLSDTTMTLFCIYFYVTRLAQIRGVYSEAAGLWWHFKYLSIGEMISNLLLNLWLGRMIGINGILLATITTSFFCSFLGYTIITYRKLFHVSPLSYFKRNTIYYIVTVVGCIFISSICDVSGQVDGWLRLVIRGILTVSMSVLYMIVVYGIFRDRRGELRDMFILLKARVG